MDALLFSLSTTSPIIVMLLLGQLLYRCKMLSPLFIQQGSSLVFKICLPLLLFLKMSQSDFSQMQGALRVTLISLGAIIAFCLIVWLLSVRLAPRQRGVFVQGAFRSNTAIIGLALVQNSYGDNANVISSLYVAGATILANVLAVLVLNGANAKRTAEQSPVGLFFQELWQNILAMLCNPLILGTSLGLLYSYLALPDIAIAEGSDVPQYLQWLAKSASYLARITLPLALICIGATLRLERLHSQKSLLLLVNLLKLFGLPLFGLAAVILLQTPGNTDPTSLGVVFLMFASPTAAASFIMAQQMQGDADLAADIVATTTVFSIFTTTVGLLLLRLWQVV